MPSASAAAPPSPSPSPIPSEPGPASIAGPARPSPTKESPMNTPKHRPSESPVSPPSSPAVPDSRPRRIVTLTSQRPVQIADDEWGEIARSEFEGPYGEQPNPGEMSKPSTYSADAKLIVRRHADGRFLVYGTYSVHCVTTRVPGVFVARHGEIVPDPETVQRSLPHCPADGGWTSVVAAIKRACCDLAAAVPASRIGPDMAGVQGLSLKCISNLPCQDLTGSGK